MGEILGLMEKAGFARAEYRGPTTASTSRFTQGGLFWAEKGAGR